MGGTSFKLSTHYRMSHSFKFTWKILKRSMDEWMKYMQHWLLQIANTVVTGTKEFASDEGCQFEEVPHAIWYKMLLMILEFFEVKCEMPSVQIRTFYILFCAFFVFKCCIYFQWRQIFEKKKVYRKLVSRTVPVPDSQQKSKTMPFSNI